MKQCEGLEKDALIRKPSVMDSGERNLKRSQLKYFSKKLWMIDRGGVG